MYSFLCGRVFLILWNIFLGTELLGLMGFPGSSDGKESACIVEDLGLLSELGRSPGEGNGNSLQYSCLENPWMEEPGGKQSMSGKELDTTE